MGCSRGEAVQGTTRQVLIHKTTKGASCPLCVEHSGLSCCACVVPERSQPRRCIAGGFGRRRWRPGSPSRQLARWPKSIAPRQLRVFLAVAAAAFCEGLLEPHRMGGHLADPIFANSVLDSLRRPRHRARRRASSEPPNWPMAGTDKCLREVTVSIPRTCHRATTFECSRKHRPKLSRADPHAICRVMSRACHPRNGHDALQIRRAAEFPP